MGFHYPFFTFGDFLLSALCSLVVLWFIATIFSGCRGCSFYQKKDSCDDCVSDDESGEKKLRKNSSRRKVKKDNES